MRSYAFVAFPAGETYLYSNLSYAVLERVLERATGLAYPALLRREVFAPLAMDDSFVAGDGEGRPSPAVGYRPDGTPIGSYTSLPRSSLGDPLPIRLDFQADGDVHVTLAGQLPTLLAEPHWENGLLSGAFLGELRLAEAAGHPHRIELALRPGGALSGFATASFSNARGAFDLPVYVALHKEQRTASTGSRARSGRGSTASAGHHSR